MNENLKATGFPHNNEKGVPYYETKVIPYKNMIYIDGEKGFVFQKGKLSHCYDKISEVRQYENSEGKLMLQISYFYDAPLYRKDYNGNFCASLATGTNRDFFRISEFDKIVVRNR